MFGSMDSPGEDTLLLDAARAIRGFLPELVEQCFAAEVDDELVRLLALAEEGKPVLEQVAAVLSRSPETLDWVSAYLEHGVPPEFAEVRERVFQGLEGVPAAPAPEKYRCPSGDFVFYRRSVGIPVPQCPTHQIPLER